MNIKELTKLIEDNGFSIKNVDGMLIVEGMKESFNNVPNDLLSFITVYEKETSIVNNNGVYQLTVTTMSANNFMKLLNAVFSSDYNFTLTGEYQIDITPKTNESSESNESNLLNKDINLLKIAEEFDSEDVTIELTNEDMKVICAEPLKWAESVDKKYGDILELEITEEFILVKGK